MVPGEFSRKDALVKQVQKRFNPAEINPKKFHWAGWAGGEDER